MGAEVELLRARLLLFHLVSSRARAWETSVAFTHVGWTGLGPLLQANRADDVDFCRMKSVVDYMCM